MPSLNSQEQTAIEVIQIRLRGLDQKQVAALLAISALATQKLNYDSLIELISPELYQLLRPDLQVLSPIGWHQLTGILGSFLRPIPEGTLRGIEADE